MAIKISGNTVIDDSRNLTNIGTITANNFIGDGSQLTNIETVQVLKPTNTSPADGTTGVSLTPTLCGSTYRSLYGKTHTCSCFQVSECSDFSTCNVFTCEIAGACTSLAVPASCLTQTTQHFFRLRYEDQDGCCSNFSDATCFTTEALPTVLGQSYTGGFYMGTICAAGSCYYLIMAPNATGCACCVWKTDALCSGVGNDQVNGFGNTYDHLANATHPAGNWTATRSIGGFSDWYLPAICELQQLYTNQASSPAGEGFALILYWSSTENDAAGACRQNFSNGNIYGNNKNSTNRVRAIRRVAFPL